MPMNETLSSPVPIHKITSRFATQPELFAVYGTAHGIEHGAQLSTYAKATSIMLRSLLEHPTTRVTISAESDKIVLQTVTSAPVDVVTGALNEHTRFMEESAKVTQGQAA